MSINKALVERRQKQIEDMATRMVNKSSVSVGVAHRRHLLDPNMMSDADKKAAYLLQQELEGESSSAYKQLGELANTQIGE